MRLHWLWRVVVALSLVTSVPGTPAADPEPMTGPMPQTRMVLTQTDAFALLPPELVAAPVVTSLWFSGSGRYVMAARTRVKITAAMVREAEAGREPPVGEFSLVLWDSRERATREVWKAPWAGAFVQQIEWLPQSDVALALVGGSQGAEKRQALLRVPPLGGQAQVIPLIDPSNSAIFDLYVSPTQPLAILHQTINVSYMGVRPDGTNGEVEERRETLTLIGPSGPPGRSLALPEDTRTVLMTWDEAGNPILRLFQVGPEGSRRVGRWYALDPQTAALRPLPKQPPPNASNPVAAGDRSPETLLRVRLVPTSAREGEASQNVGLLWLESVAKSEKPRALICGDSTGGQFLPGGAAVVYFSQGAVWAAPLLRLSREEYQVSVVRAQQVETIGRAKQVGLALMMYAQDNDGALPSTEEWHSQLALYMRDSSFLESFVYTHLGGKLSEIKNPAEAELGYMSAPGGRVVVYADGHAALTKE
jgi:hypothetical protein